MNFKFALIAAAGALAISGCDIEIDGETDGGSYTPDISYQCQSAVANTANRSMSEVTAGFTSETPQGYLMHVYLSGADAHWNCYTDFLGSVQRVEYSQEG